MNNKKKLIAIIGGVLVVIAVVVLCVCLIPHNEPTPEVPGETIDKTDGNGPSITPVTDPEVLKEYEELKDKVKDVYEHEPKEPFIYDDGDYKYTVKDVISLYETFPSTQVENKDSEGSVLKESIFEITNNLEDFNHVLLENTKPEIGENGEVEYPYLWDYFGLDLDKYGYKEMEYPQSTYRYSMYRNSKDIMFIDELFGSEAMYYQACYDVMIEFINMVPKEKLKDCFAAMQSMYTFDAIYQACDEGDYSALFDGIMNHKITFVYKDEAGIFYRLEVSQWDADYDGEQEDCFNITVSYDFDDEEKFV